MSIADNRSLGFPQWCCPFDRLNLRECQEALACASGHEFPAIRGVYRFTSGETYADAFGVQWNKYRTTQLDSHTGTTISRDRALRCMGTALWNNLEGRNVLECGCGAGRFTELLLGAGARVTSVDLSNAVDANAENCPPSPFHRIAQADILRLPFLSGQYDIVFCLGVIQHTPRPVEAIAKLWEQVKPSGHLVIDHYSHRLSWYLRTAPLFRAVLRRLPSAAGLVWTQKLVNSLLPLHLALRGSPMATRLFQRLSPVSSYYHVFPELPDSLQREWALLDTHDALTDWYKHWSSRRHIRNILARLGAEKVWCEYGGNGVEARALRAATTPSQIGY